ncbi:DUF2478 domain-containing protein [Rhodovulum sp. MB263]|uniref:DUF2478 domain-containing protein n=1 Tax=Rhodovulum sp. (strain MB263) TaxID=308754 RepID=UPI0009B76F15|nr:DUF2478 domain-containing protein [Rhodovulum sp. MB263]ARC90712.1 hypothetical protein B5V46_18720 [Rhodovulum sp. MB263]
MRFGYIVSEERGAASMVLAEAATQLSARGLRLAGAVQHTASAPGPHPCDGDLKVLPDGPVLRLSQPLGRGSRGCRMDAGAVETAAAEAARHLDGAALLIVNKFGKLEAAGHGFVPLIAEALGRGLPVLVGVNGLNLRAFESFAEGLAEPVAAESGAVLAWLGYPPVLAAAAVSARASA